MSRQLCVRCSFELGDQLENDFFCCTSCEHRNVNGACSGRNKKNGRRTNKCDSHDLPPVTHHILQAAERSKENGYMGDVARVHAELMQKKKPE